MLRTSTTDRASPSTDSPSKPPKKLTGKRITCSAQSPYVQMAKRLNLMSRQQKVVHSQACIQRIGEVVQFQEKQFHERLLQVFARLDWSFQYDAGPETCSCCPGKDMGAWKQ